MLSVLIQIDENDRQLLGFIELNAPELYSTAGNLVGMPNTCAH
jgi:hypothetical protein